MHSLSVMMKPASGSCNMKCDYCFYCDEMENRTVKSYGMMEESTLKNIIRKTLPRVQHQIAYAYQGGEPLLRGLPFFEKAVQLQKQYNHNHVVVTNALQTNGLLLNEDWCRFFKENNFLVGVSLDGTAEVHDSLRHLRADGTETYEKIRENIAILDRFGVEYNILTVVTEQSAANIRQIYEDYKRNNWMYQQYIECLDPIGMATGSTPYSLSPERFGKFMTELFDLWYADLQQGKQPYIRKFENYIGMLLGRCPEACEQTGSCSIQIVVEADGSAYPCDFYMLDEYRLGNFNADRLPDLDRRREEIGFVSRSRKITEACRSCEYYSICRSGCQRYRAFYPHEQAYQNQFCEGYRYFFDHCLERMERIAKSLTGQSG